MSKKEQKDVAPVDFKDEKTPISDLTGRSISHLGNLYLKRRVLKLVGEGKLRLVGPSQIISK
jgi:hypothetical protein